MSVKELVVGTQQTTIKYCRYNTKGANEWMDERKNGSDKLLLLTIQQRLQHQHQYTICNVPRVHNIKQQASRYIQMLKFRLCTAREVA